MWKYIKFSEYNKFSNIWEGTIINLLFSVRFHHQLLQIHENHETNDIIKRVKSYINVNLQIHSYVKFIWLPKTFLGHARQPYT